MNNLNISYGKPMTDQLADNVIFEVQQFQKMATRNSKNNSKDIKISISAIPIRT